MMEALDRLAMDHVEGRRCLDHPVLPLMTVGMRIWATRQRAGLTQTEFAQKIGVAQGMISKWESGKELPRLGSVRHIAETFGVSIDWLSEAVK
jgi:transcriptional regulator with XRE-family HTH domain